MKRWAWAVLLGLVLGLSVRLAWSVFGPYNAPLMPLAAAVEVTDLHSRITLPAGFKFTVYATDLGVPRLMQMTPDGDLIVSGFRSDNLLLVKRDADGDGKSDGQSVLKDDLHLPHGLLLEGRKLYVAEETRVLAYDFDGTALSNEKVILTGLPDGGDHNSRTLKRGPDGFLYLSIGSSCNACIEEQPWRAAIIRFKEGVAPEVFASGLRNSVGFDWQPETGRLYGVDNGRDYLGDDVPDDEVNRIGQGKFYGWPYVHGADVKDPGLFGQMPAGTEVNLPVHGLGAHVAPLSLRFLKNQPDTALNGTALVAEHGSWNRSVKAGYRIIRLVFEGDSVREEVFLSGCELHDEVICRPVDVLEAPDGSLFVSDDYAGAIYHIVKAP